MRAFVLRSDDGKEAAGSASVVKGGCEDVEGSGESETLGTSGGEKAGADAWGGRTESDDIGCEV